MIYIKINTTMMLDNMFFTKEYNDLLEFLRGPCNSPLVSESMYFKNHRRLQFKTEEDKAEFILTYM